MYLFSFDGTARRALSDGGQASGTCGTWVLSLRGHTQHVFAVALRGRAITATLKVEVEPVIALFSWYHALTRNSGTGSPKNPKPFANLTNKLFQCRSNHLVITRLTSGTIGVRRRRTKEPPRLYRSFGRRPNSNQWNSRRGRNSIFY